MGFWPEREEKVNPIKETWEAVLQQAQKKDPLVRQALERANKLCIPLFEPTGPLEYFLKFKEDAEWQIFYTHLLARLVMTDEKNEGIIWRNTLKVIDPVRVELLKKLTLPAVKANEWLKIADNAAQMIVTVQRSRTIDSERKPGQIAGLAQKYGRELAKIRED